VYKRQRQQLIGSEEALRQRWETELKKKIDSEEQRNGLTEAVMLARQLLLGRAA